MSVQVGVIAEDKSDVEVIEALLDKIAKKNYSTRSFVGHGGGKILGKCNAWARDLKARGCTCLLVVHDLDTRNLTSLQAELRGALGVSPIAQYALVIPVTEIEAWLLADHAAIGKTFKVKKPVKKIANPEASKHAKEDLRDLISKITKNRTTYLNTLHNRQIAENVAIANLKRCVSFITLHDFAEKYLGKPQKRH